MACGRSWLLQLLPLYLGARYPLRGMTPLQAVADRRGLPGYRRLCLMSNGPTRPPAGLGGDRPNPRRPRLWVETFSPQSTRPVQLVALNDWLHGFDVHF